MQRLTLMILLALALGALPGCQASKPPKPDDALAWTQEPMPAATNGAIYQAGREVILAENPVGSLPSSTGGMIQLPSLALAAWDTLKLSSDQNIGSQRSLSCAATVARCAEFTTRTA